MPRDRSADRLADAVKGLARQVAKTNSLRMVRGMTTATADVIDVGNGVTVRVTAWVNRPAVGSGKRVVLLMQQGSVVALGQD